MTATDRAAEAGTDTAGQGATLRQWAPQVLRYLTIPVVLVVVCLALYLYIQGLELDSIEARNINTSMILLRARQHIELVAVSTAIVLTITIPLGITLTRPFAKRITPYAIGLANIGQATPSIGLVVLLALIWTFGFWPAIVALVAYSALSILRNTMVGLEQVDESIIESGLGMGLSKRDVLFKIELPLAVPVILAGVRTALILNVGTATLATFVDAPSMGTLIDNGISLSRPSVVIVGSVLTAVLALTIDWIAGIVEDVLRPHGL